jgi:hypothetical protein
MSHPPSANPENGLARTRLLVLDAAAWLLERGELEAARAVFGCSLEVEPPLDATAAPGALWVRVVAPARVAHILLDEDTPVSWQARNAIVAALPPGYSVAALTVESESVGGSRLALVA